MRTFVLNENPILWTQTTSAKHFVSGNSTFLYEAGEKAEIITKLTPFALLNILVPCEYLM